MINIWRNTDPDIDPEASMYRVQAWPIERVSRALNGGWIPEGEDVPMVSCQDEIKPGDYLVRLFGGKVISTVRKDYFEKWFKQS